MSRTQHRLAAGFSLVVLLVLVAVGVFALHAARDRELADLRAGLQVQAQLVADRVEALGVPSVSAAPPADLDRIVREAGRSAGVRVTLIDRGGVVLADSALAPEELSRVENHATRREVAAALAGTPGSAERISVTVGRPFLYVAVPAPGGGAVRLAMDLAAVDARTDAARADLLKAGLLGLVLTMLIAYAVLGAALRPVRQLRGVLEGIASGRGPVERLPWHDADEFGAIASAVNRIATELRGALAQTSAEKERLQAVLLAMVEGVLVVDTEGKVVLANPRFRDLFAAWGAVEGRRALEVVRRPDVESALERAAAGNEPVTAEIASGGEDGRVIRMHAGRFPAEGPRQGTVAIFHDETGIRRLERIRREFAANVSHELRTPLTAIRGFAETLASGGVPVEQAKSYLEVILRHANRLSMIIEDVLTLSRIEGRREALRPAPVAVTELARSLLRDLESRLAARGIEARVTGDPEAEALADRRALEHVLSNLIDNAIKYSQPGGRVEVHVEEVGARVRIEVRDQGIGIAAADRERIFERFYRTDRARSHDFAGSGLGLAIVKHLVLALNGVVTVESAEGHGSCFAVTLPSVKESTRHATFTDS